MQLGSAYALRSLFSSPAEPALIPSMAKAKRKTANKKRQTTGKARKAASKSAKTAKPAPARRPKHEKAAIRSDAFAKAILDAKSYRDDPDSLRELFEQASAKAAVIPKTSLNELGPYLQAMLRLVRAYALRRLSRHRQGCFVDHYRFHRLPGRPIRSDPRRSSVPWLCR